MTFNKMMVISLLFLGLIGSTTLWCQDQQIKQGEVVVLHPDRGCFSGGPVFVLKKTSRLSPRHMFSR